MGGKRAAGAERASRPGNPPGGRPARPPGGSGNQPPRNHPGARGQEPRLTLPFQQKQKKDAGDWVYRHRVGLLVTVVLYLLGGIMFVSYKIVVNKAPSETMYVDLVTPEDFEPMLPEEMQQLIEELEAAGGAPVQNRASNENAQLNPNLRDSKNTRAQDVYDEARRIQEQLAAGQQAYREGMGEVEAIRTATRENTSPSSDRNSNDPQQDNSVKVQGNVSVRYDLDGRFATYLHMPAYQCRGAGTVVVSITVNRNGKVTDATVTQRSAGAEDCIPERAVQAALASSFNADPKASDRQKGTITYTFVAQ